jgi:hypothetical protein
MGLNMNHVGKPRDKKMLHAMIMAALIKTRSRSRRMRHEPACTRAIRAIRSNSIRSERGCPLRL